jgi:hypothetical protein
MWLGEQITERESVWDPDHLCRDYFECRMRLPTLRTVQLEQMKYTLDPDPDRGIGHAVIIFQTVSGDF